MGFALLSPFSFHSPGASLPFNFLSALISHFLPPACSPLDLLRKPPPMMSLEENLASLFYQQETANHKLSLHVSLRPEMSAELDCVPSEPQPRRFVGCLCGWKREEDDDPAVESASPACCRGSTPRSRVCLLSAELLCWRGLGWEAVGEVFGRQRRGARNQFIPSGLQRQFLAFSLARKQHSKISSLLLW